MATSLRLSHSASRLPDMIDHRRISCAVLVLTLLCSGVAVQTASADTSASVRVTASIGIEPSLSISVCDDTAVFGTGLTNEGTAPANADPGVFATSAGIEEGQGVFYVWSALCSPAIHFDGNVIGAFNACGTENASSTASPDLQLEQADLVLLNQSPPYTTYEGWDSFTVSIPPCPMTILAGQFFGLTDFPLELGLRVDDGDGPGDFSSVVTFSVEPA